MPAIPWKKRNLVQPVVTKQITSNGITLQFRAHCRAVKSPRGAYIRSLDPETWYVNVSLYTPGLGWGECRLVTFQEGDSEKSAFALASALGWDESMLLAPVRECRDEVVALTRELMNEVDGL